MSLYADEDLATISGAGPSTYAATTAEVDPLTAFSNAVALPAESPAQAEGLVKAGQRFEDVPDRLPELCAQLLPMVVDGGDTLLRKWTLEMVLLAVGRSRLVGEVKVQVAQTSLTALLTLLSSPSPSTVKSTIHIFATIYPILFRLLAAGSAPPGMFEAFNQSKARIISLVVDPNAAPANVAQNVGVQAAGWKFVQRVMLVGTHAGSADPRLAKTQGNDPNVGMLTYASPLNANELENEASGLRNQLIAQLFQQDVPAILHPIFNIIPLLCKARPSLAPAYITTLTSWSPAQLEAKRRSGMQIRAVEKTLRSVMAHLLRHPPLAMFSVQLNDALQRQKSRLEVSWETEQNVRRAKRAAATQGMPPTMAPSASTQGAGPSNLGKHAFPDEVKPDWYGGYAAYGGQQPMLGQGMPGPADGRHDAKRPRIDNALGTGRGHAIDVSGMRLDMVLDLVMTGLRALDQDTIPRAFDNARRNLEQNNADAMPQLAPMLGVPLPGRGMYDRQGSADGGRATEVKDEKEDVLDPLEMDMDDDELLADDESDVDENITFADFTLPPPEPLSPQERDELIDDILERISASGQEMSGPVMSTGGNDPWAWLTSATSDQVKVEGKDGLRGIMDVKEMWMILLSRLATRTGTLVAKAEQGANEQDVAVRSKGRARVAEFIAADFVARSKFAALWLNEEWFSEKTSLGTTTSYTTHLVSILSSHLSNLDAHSSSSAAARSLSLFLANVPEIPLSLVDQLASMAEDADRAIVGFLALRDLVESRPPVRAKALSCLLDLCVHPDRKVRVLGISTVRRWVPGHAVSKEVVGFAEKVLSRLGYVREEVGQDGKEDGDAEGEAVKEEETEAKANTETDVKETPVELPRNLAELSHFLPLPSPKSIQQYVELPFALSRRDPALLDSIFALYPTLPPFIQGQYEDLLVPLIQSLAVGPVAAAPPTAPKGPAADKEGDGTAAVLAPQTPSEKLMALLNEYPAAGTEQLVLRVISTLSKEGKSATVRDLVRSWVEQKGEDVDVRFVVPVLGELTRAEIEVQIPRIVMLLNTPDSRDTVRTAFATLIQKLTPADLLVALHNEATPIKPTIEAIGICFSMTTVFRSDVLVASMVRIADLPNGSLPIVFMRTIIQAVTTYKSLIPFVANTVLPKLVGKKIWSAGPQLWDGFVKLAKLIAPASYGVLLQLPKEWLKDVLEKQPALKNGLKTFLAAKQGGRGVLVELFGEA